MKAKGRGKVQRNADDDFEPMPIRKCPKCGKKSGFGLEMMGKYVACDVCTNKHLAAGGSFATLEDSG